MEAKIGECFRQDLNFGNTKYKSHNLGAFIHEKSEKNGSLRTKDSEGLSIGVGSGEERGLEAWSFGFQPQIPSADSYEPFSICGALMPPNFSKNLRKEDSGLAPPAEVNAFNAPADGPGMLLEENFPARPLRINKVCTQSLSDSKKNANSEKPAQPQIFSTLLETLNLECSRTLAGKKPDRPIKKLDFWEDIGPSRRLLRELPLSGIFNKKRTKLFFKYYDTWTSSLFAKKKFLVTESYIKKNLNLMLMGIEADLFRINPASDEFFLNKDNCTLPHLSCLTLQAYLQELLQYGTMVYRLEKLRKALSTKNLSESFTHKVLLYI